MKEKQYNKVVIIAGVARSGTSWLGEIIDSSPRVRYRFQPLFSYSFKGKVNEDSTKAEYEKLFKDIYLSNDDFLLQKEKRINGLYPTFDKNEIQDIFAFKTARYQYLLEPILRKMKNVNILGIIRNPCAVINSWIKIPSEFPKDSDPLKEWRHGLCKNSGPEDFFGYYKWKEVANMYLDLEKKFPKRMKIIKYEDFAANPLKQAKNIFEFINMNLSIQTTEFIKDSTLTNDNNPYSVYKTKNVVVKWKKELNKKIIDEIKHDIEGTRLEQFYK